MLKGLSLSCCLPVSLHCVPHTHTLTHTHTHTYPGPSYLWWLCLPPSVCPSALLAAPPGWGVCVCFPVNTSLCFAVILTKSLVFLSSKHNFFFKWNTLQWFESGKSFFLSLFQDFPFPSPFSLSLGGNWKRAAIVCVCVCITVLVQLCICLWVCVCVSLGESCLAVIVATLRRSRISRFLSSLLSAQPLHLDTDHCVFVCVCMCVCVCVCVQRGNLHKWATGAAGRQMKESGWDERIPSVAPCKIFSSL